MKCENKYCIYNRDFACILDKVRINSLDICDNCIIMELDENFLEAEKERQRKEISLRRQATAVSNTGFNIGPAIF